MTPIVQLAVDRDKRGKDILIIRCEGNGGATAAKKIIKAFCSKTEKYESLSVMAF